MPTSTQQYRVQKVLTRMSSPFELSAFKVQISRDVTNNMHQHANTYEVYLNVGGHGYQHTEDQRYPMSCGDLFLFAPGQKHTASTQKSGTQTAGLVTNFTNNLFSREAWGDADAFNVLKELEAHSISKSPKIVLEEGGERRVRQAFERLITECSDQAPGFTFSAKHCLLELLANTLRYATLFGHQRSNSKSRKRRARMEQVCSYLQKHYASVVTVDHVAEMAGLSKSRFHTVFKEHTGKSLLEYLNEIRCEHACQLLKTTSLPVPDIASHCGFNSTSHFYLTLRKYVNQSPGEIRHNSERPA
jgi:AraC-like DNA-binding protein/quercetin dioxygenase-like cupin family protein